MWQYDLTSSVLKHIKDYSCMCDYRGAQTSRVSIMESKSFPGGVAFCTAVSSHPYDTVREPLFCFSHLHHQVTFLSQELLFSKYGKFYKEYKLFS